MLFCSQRCARLNKRFLVLSNARHKRAFLRPHYYFIGYRLSAIGYRLSAIGYRLSGDTL
ncbi:hypothetical protein QNH14_16425 [Apirhabdus apintestini]|nr:hypothetical protein QNH14_16425 [Enterobacteriaceae bacterium CA-0114]